MSTKDLPGCSRTSSWRSIRQTLPGTCYVVSMTNRCVQVFFRLAISPNSDSDSDSDSVSDQRFLLFNHNGIGTQSDVHLHIRSGQFQFFFDQRVALEKTRIGFHPPLGRHRSLRRAPNNITHWNNCLPVVKATRYPLTRAATTPLYHTHVARKAL